MTAILFLIAIAAVLWTVGLNGLVRWAGVAAIALGLTVMLGIDSGQGLPLVAAGIVVWLIGKAIQPVPPPRHYAL